MFSPNEDLLPASTRFRRQGGRRRTVNSCSSGVSSTGAGADIEQNCVAGVGAGEGLNYRENERSNERTVVDIEYLGDGETADVPGDGNLVNELVVDSASRALSNSHNTDEMKSKLVNRSKIRCNNTDESSSQQDAITTEDRTSQNSAGFNGNIESCATPSVPSGNATLSMDRLSTSSTSSSSSSSATSSSRRQQLCSTRLTQPLESRIIRDRDDEFQMMRHVVLLLFLCGSMIVVSRFVPYHFWWRNKIMKFYL